MSSTSRPPAFEHTLKALYKPVEAHYHDGAGDTGIFESPAQRDDVVARVASFAASCDARRARVNSAP